MVSYKDSGVDISEGYKAVARYKESAKRTLIPGVLGGLGNFNGMFSLPAGLKEPVLVSGTDGVGTKLDLAFRLKKYDTVGIDCVAMSVNDILCSGVKTSFFLDYIACGKLSSKIAGELVKGVATGCVRAGAALLGGETAEMPGFYEEGKYDLAGFGVGIAEKSRLITGERVGEKDVLIGLSSSGVHSNGFSLVRKLVKDLGEEFIKDGKGGRTIGEELLTPTRIYTPYVLEVLEEDREAVHGMAHITGGGFYENIPRMFNSDKKLMAVVEKGTWKIPKIFDKLVEKGADITTIFNTFNMGIGYVLAVDKKKADRILGIFNENASKYKEEEMEEMRAYRIGEVRKRQEGEGELVIIGQ